MLVRAAGVVNTKKCWQESKTCVAVVLRKRTTRRACARVSYNTRTIVACSTTPPLRAPCPPLCGDVDYDTPLCDITYYPPPSPMYMLLSLSLSLSPHAPPRRPFSFSSCSCGATMLPLFCSCCLHSLSTRASSQRVSKSLSQIARLSSSVLAHIYHG